MSKYKECGEFSTLMRELLYVNNNYGFDYYYDKFGEIISNLDVRLGDLKAENLHIYFDYIDCFECFLIVARNRKSDIDIFKNIVGDFLELFENYIVNIIMGCENKYNILNVKIKTESLKNKIRKNRMEITHGEISDEIEREYFNMSEEERLELDKMLKI